MIKIEDEKITLSWGECHSVDVKDIHHLSIIYGEDDEAYMMSITTHEQVGSVRRYVGLKSWHDSTSWGNLAVLKNVHCTFEVWPYF